MTWRTIAAAAVFIGMCGFIAYWGDLLGRRLGKRRLSLLGLRPRHTAIVFTTITGMLIAIFTIAFMAAISQRVRLLMLEGEKILRDRDILVQKFENAREAADAARGEAARAQSEARTAILQRDKLVGEVRRISASLTDMRAKLLKNEAALARTEKALTSAAAEIRQRKAEIAHQRYEIQNLESQRGLLVGQISMLEAEMGEAIVKYQRYIALREKTVILRSNEELVRATIDCTQAKPQLRGEVLSLLNKADHSAREKGARVGDNNRAVRIITKRITGPEGSDEQTVTENASISALVDELSTGSGTVVLRIVAIGNTVEDEQALVEFIPNYNRLVYWKGQEVAEARIDGAASRGDILGGVISFLRAEVRPAAIAKGIIPYHDKEQDQLAVGSMSPDQLLNIVDEVSSHGRPVVVRAVARADTWSAGPLDLDFRIEAL